METSTALSTQTELTASAELDNFNNLLTLTVHEHRPEPLAVFSTLSAPQRNALAADAWRVGLRAVVAAHRQAEESRLSDLGRELRGDVKALANIEGMIHRELERLEKMRDLSAKIEKHARELQDEVRKGSDKMGTLLKKARSTLKALNVELEAEEVTLVLPGSSMDEARQALEPVVAEELEVAE